MNRRSCLGLLGSASALLLLSPLRLSGGEKKRTSLEPLPQEAPAKIFFAKGEDVRKVTRQLLETLGGMEAIIDKEDIVVLKPNSQQVAQGATNTDVMAAFIEAVLGIPGFQGEIIIADNHQSQEENSRGWTTDKRNGRFNLNELVEFFQNKGFRNVTKYHWHPAGPNPTPLMMDGYGDHVVSHPSEGDGYVWPEDLYYLSPYGNKTILPYPIFTSACSGVTIDLKNGAYKNGRYTGQPVKFINFSALNHHGLYTGVTASVKNFMGVVDMSCGYPAPKPEGTYNTHFNGATSLFKLLSRHRGRLERIPSFWEFYLSPHIFRFRYTGGVLGRFMKTIRKADLHIITAIRVGWGSRTDPNMSYTANAVVAGYDPVALDCWASENVLLKATKEVRAPKQYVELNDPKIRGGPLQSFLEECRLELGGTLDLKDMSVIKV